MEESVDSELSSQTIAKQKSKPKKKNKSTSSERTVHGNSETSQEAHQRDDSVKIINALTERLCIDDYRSLMNGDSENHNNNVSCLAKAKFCTDERNKCSNQSDINCDETNLGNKKSTKQTHSTSNSIGKVCNGIAAHSPPNLPSPSSPPEPSTSFVSTEIEPKPLTEIVETPPVTTTASDNIARHTNELEQQDIVYKVYENELQMPDIMRLIQKDLSEPYSIYTYRYFIHNWPKLCFLAMHGTVCVGAIVCKLDIHRQQSKRGYIAMLAVDKDYRKLKIGTNLVAKAIQAMLVYNADEVVLETEITNIPALRLYENLGFVRDKRLFGYYLNGVDALRLKLWFR